MLRQTLSLNLTYALQQFITFVIALVIIAKMNFLLSLSFIVSVLIFVTVAAFSGKSIQRLSKISQDSIADVNVIVQESLSGIRTIKAFCGEETQMDYHSNSIKDYFTNVQKRNKVRAILNPVNSFLRYTSLLVTVWLGGWFVMQGNLSIGELVAFLMYGTFVASPLQTFADTYASFKSAAGASERVFEILDQPLEANRSLVTLPNKTNVSIESLSFSYPNTQKNILNDISITINQGEKIGIVGTSGTGKSTLISLLLGFYKPTSGRISINGYDLEDVPIYELRRRIALVDQDTFLFSGTIEENIRFGDKDAKIENVIEAAEKANANFFISNLSDGYNTKVGDRGVKLSGGQRQRIALARAILKKADVLILDEATSNLDSESESFVQESISSIGNDATTIVIAHRFASLMQCNRILVLAKGKIIEEGSHDELMSFSSNYRELYQISQRQIG